MPDCVNEKRNLVDSTGFLIVKQHTSAYGKVEGRQFMSGARAISIFRPLLITVFMIISLWSIPQLNAQSSVELVPALNLTSSAGPGQPNLEVCFGRTVAVPYSGGAIWISSQPDTISPFAIDDALRIRVTRPDGSTSEFYVESYTQDVSSFDFSSYLQIGYNSLEVEIIDLLGPNCGGSAVYLTTSGQPPIFTQTITAPYDTCGHSAHHSASLPAGRPQIIAHGFSSASAACDAQQGAVNTSVVAFGGRSGNILGRPSHEADAYSHVSVEFIPPFTGTLRVDAIVSTNANAGAAAGSDTAIPSVQSVVQDVILLNHSALNAFINIARAVIWETGAGVRTDNYLYIITDIAEYESSELVGGHGLVATFPIPPWSQNRDFNSEQTTVSLSIPVTEGRLITIKTGLRTTTSVYGWAEAHWNPRGDQNSFVTSITLTEVR